MSQKLLSIAVPAYNSEGFIEHCVETLLTGGERIEILIINDGSKDGTGAIADRYASLYPGLVKAVHQENGGHGDAVNTGLRNAVGKFFKVVDSDDWVDQEAFQDVLDTLEVQQDYIELLICNYVYEKQGAKNKKVMEYSKYLPVNRIFTWEEIKPFPVGKYLMMHSVIYKTETLRSCGITLPKHTFYVDNIFIFKPLPMVKQMYYLDVDFYRYFIGRDDQSVNEKVMISRLEQQMRVNLIVAEIFVGMEIPNVNLRKYMFNHLSITTIISSILAIRSGSEEHLAMKDKLWTDLKELDSDLYRELRYTLFGIGVHLPGVCGRKIAVAVYKLAQKIYGFN